MEIQLYPPFESFLIFFSLIFVLILYNIIQLPVLFKIPYIHLKKILLIVRIFLFLTLSFLLLRPNLLIHQPEIVEGNVIILTDFSKSMNIDINGVKRISLGLKSIRNNNEIIEKMSKNNVISYYYFGHESFPTKISQMEDETPKFNKTDIYNSIEMITEEYKKYNKKIGAFFVISDGADNGILSARFDRGKPLIGKNGSDVPIFTIFSAHKDDIKDLLVKDVIYNEIAFIKNPIEITAIIENKGFDEINSGIFLYEGNQLVNSGSISKLANNQTQEIKFNVFPNKSGKHLYTLKVNTLPEEVITDNNEKSFIIDVIRDKVRVLHVSGHPSWDTKFLRRALKDNPNVDLISFYILRTNEDLINDTNENDLSLIPFPHRELFGPELKTFDVVIFQDFSYLDFFPIWYLDNVKKFVLNGGGFFMLGGNNSFLDGGYSNSPIKDILPLEMKGNIIEGEFQTKLTNSGKNHPITKLNTFFNENQKIWDSNPILKNHNSFGRIEPQSTVLVQTKKQKKPIIAIREVGEGRSLIFATDSIWKINFLRVAKGENNELYNSLIRNSIDWLSGDMDDQMIRITTKTMNQDSPYQVQIDVNTVDLFYNPIVKSPYKIKVVDYLNDQNIYKNNGKTGNNGNVQENIQIMSNGNYEIQFDVLNIDKKWVSEKSKIIIENVDVENREVNSRSDILELISKETGGEKFHYNDKWDVKISKNYEIDKTKSINYPIWNSIYLFLFLVSLFLLDWWIRKNTGLA